MCAGQKRDGISCRSVDGSVVILGWRKEGVFQVGLEAKAQKVAHGRREREVRPSYERVVVVGRQRMGISSCLYPFVIRILIVVLVVSAGLRTVRIKVSGCVIARGILRFTGRPIWPVKISFLIWFGMF